MVLNWFSILSWMDLDAVCEAMEESSEKKGLTLEIEDPASFSSSGCLGFVVRFLGAQGLEVEDEAVVFGGE